MSSKAIHADQIAAEPNIDVGEAGTAASFNGSLVGKWLAVAFSKTGYDYAMVYNNTPVANATRVLVTEDTRSKNGNIKFEDENGNTASGTAARFDVEKESHITLVDP